MRDLTIIMPHFQNLGMLHEQQQVWADYPADLRARLHVVVVDDCSPKGARPGPKAVTVDGLGSFRIYRLVTKARWNWPACRNLGASVATTDWLLLTDIDHVVPAETLAALLEGDLQAGSVYRFSRVDAPHPWPYPLSACAPYKMHNDTWLLERRLFFSPLQWAHHRYVRGVGGYDERLSGCYGTSGEFRDRVMATAALHILRTEPVIRYPREIIPDASTHPSVYTRKNDPVNDEDLRMRKVARAKLDAWQPLRGLIPYEDVYSTVPEVTASCA